MPSLASIGLAFAAGLLSISSPCVLPLLPGYLGYLTGMSARELEQNRWKSVHAAIFFVVGFSAVFVALGASASELGALLVANRLPLSRVAGGFILAMGVLLLLEGRAGVSARRREWGLLLPRGQPAMGVPLGAAFAITWTPCVGPVLGAILALAGTTASLGQGAALLAIYSLGLAVPFVVLSVSVMRIRPWLSRLRRGTAALQSASGALFVAMGILLVTGQWLILLSPVLNWYAGAKWPPL